MDEIQDFIITEMKAVYDRGDNSKSHGIWGKISANTSIRANL